jgi:hypothetical protein
MPRKKSNNSPRFAVGEPVILQNATYFTEWNGALAVIVEALAWRRTTDLLLAEPCRLYCYRARVLAAGGHIVHAAPHQLRKLREPGEEDSGRTDEPRRQSERTPEPVIVR